MKSERRFQISFLAALALVLATSLGHATATRAQDYDYEDEEPEYRLVDMGDGTVKDCRREMRWLKDEEGCLSFFWRDNSGPKEGYNLQGIAARIRDLKKGECGLTEDFAWEIADLEDFECGERSWTPIWQEENFPFNWDMLTWGGWFSASLGACIEGKVELGGSGDLYMVMERIFFDYSAEILLDGAGIQAAAVAWDVDGPGCDEISRSTGFYAGGDASDAD